MEEKKEALQERDQAQGEKQQAIEAGKKDIQKLEQLTQVNEDLKRQLDEKNSELNRLTTLNRIQEKETMPRDDRDDSKYAEKITQLENQVKSAEALAPIMTSEAKYVFYRNQLLRAFENILIALKNLNDRNPEVKEKHRKAAYEMMNNLTKQLEVYPPIPTFTVIQ